MDLDAITRSHVPLGPYTTLGVGGPARWFLEASTTAQACQAIQHVDDQGIPLLIFGGGSNLLIADAGFDGLVLRLPDHPGQAEADGRWILPAGAHWDQFVEQAVACGHAGVECLAGIPGTVGAAPIQNVGAYGQEVAEVIEAVEVWDRHAHVRRWIAGADCGFGYRHSRFKGADAGRFVVLSVRLQLRPDGPATVRYRDLQNRLGPAPSLDETRTTVLAVRRSKSMVLDPADPNTRSAGSFFVNPIVDEARFAAVCATYDGDVPHWTVDGGIKLAAAWLIERSGMPKGFGEGPVGLSTRHTLAVVNRGGASAAEVRAFASQVQRRVAARFGVELVPEPRFVGFNPPA
jgi:UDP-N-acetylmuramate dehydrogenase